MYGDDSNTDLIPGYRDSTASGSNQDRSDTNPICSSNVLENGLHLLPATDGISAVGNPTPRELPVSNTGTAETHHRVRGSRMIPKLFM